MPHLLLLLLLKLWLWPFGPTVQPEGGKGAKARASSVVSFALAVQVASATQFSSQMLFTALSRLACPPTAREPGCPACGYGESRAEHVTPSSSREQGSFRQNLGKHSRSRQWFPGYLVVQFLSLGH